MIHNDFHPPISSVAMKLEKTLLQKEGEAVEKSLQWLDAEAVERGE